MASPSRSSRRGSRIVSVVFAIAVINFMTFFFVSMSLGGDAVNGHAADGRYYLSAKGRDTEVSRAVWVYSYAHTVSVWVTHASAFIAAIALFGAGGQGSKEAR